MRRRIAGTVILAAFCVAGAVAMAGTDQRIAGGGSHPPAAAPATAPAVDVPPSPPDYVIGADDVLSVVFWRDQTLSGNVLVRPDGKISIPLLDDVQAEGLTPTELRDRLVVVAKRFVADPVATVVVKQINSRKVYITGLVGKPGQYQLTRSMTVLQLIATAGGLLDFAKSREIQVVRTERGQAIKLRFDYAEMIKNPERATRNIELRPGDTVVVP